MKFEKYLESLKRETSKDISRSAVTYLIKKYAWMSFGPISMILNFVVTKLVDIIIYNTQLAVYFKYIDFRVDEQGQDFHNAIIKNMNAQENGTEQDRINAEKNLKAAFAHLVKLSNV